jgi:tryptophanyl-tRNA synthetase
MTEIPLGLYLYPVLQVADILLYKSNCVPVGDDQLPHMNFAKHLSSKFNNTFSKIFPIPETICNEFSGRIKSLRNPEKKMSKSELDMKSRIEIIDSADEIRLKCKRAVTDMISEVTFDPISRPGVSNLVLIYSLISGLTPEQVCEKSVGLDTGKFKLLLSDLVVEHFKPIREEVMRLMNEDLYLHQVLSEGSNKALQIAENTMNEVYEAIGFKF